MYCPDNLAPYCPDYTYGAGTTKMRLQCTDGYYVLKNCASNVATNFEYPASVNELLINEPMATLEPTINCYKCSFLVRQENEEAELPAGLQMNSTTGSISGTPTELVDNATYTIIARVLKGDAKTTITFIVKSEKANYAITIIIVICVVLLVALFGTCFFVRVRGVGRNQRKNRNLKSGSKTATTNRV